VFSRPEHKLAGQSFVDRKKRLAASPAGRMVLTVFAGIAEFERALI
jgi:DNA invertase Pin-like site-specific DNA recombinase